MAVSLRLRRLLTGEYATYRLVPGHVWPRARAIAAAACVPRPQFAKSVVLRDGAGGYLMAVIPSNMRLDLAGVAAASGRPGVRLAREREIGTLFPDCELGAMPPFGELYGLPTYVDPCFRNHSAFVFQGGSHDELVAMCFADFESLTRAVIGPACLHVKPGARLALPAARGRGVRDGKDEPCVAGN
jgi:Ala-tRNA(Pro) deacylase